MTIGNDILILALARGDDDYGSTAWSLAQAIAENRRVFYIEHPYTWKEAATKAANPRLQARRKARSKRNSILKPILDQVENLHVLVPPVMLPINFLPEGKLYDRLLAFNRTAFNHWLTEQIETHDIQAEIWLNIFNPYFNPPLEGIKKVYYCIDRMEEAPYLQKHGPALEQQIIRDSDIVLNTSKFLLNHSQLSGAKRAELLRNAADFPLFAKAVSISAPLPFAMKERDAPVNLIYIGSNDDRIDVGLVQQIVQQRPNWQWWWIGPVKRDAVSPLFELPQCRFLGSLPQRELSNWLRHADCGVIPFKCNAFTQAIYPLKVHEYLASGNGVVSTPFSKDMLQLHPHTLNAQTADEWVLSIEKLIPQNKTEQRKIRSAFASQHSWTSRASELFSLLSELPTTSNSNIQKKRLSA
ncbi:MAG: glycosyltransferase [Bacteroidota bacterium]